MALRDLYALSKNEYITMFRNFISECNNLESTLSNDGIRYGHGHIGHDKLTDKQMIKCIFSEKSCVSTFDKDINIDEIVSEIMYFSTPKIATWLMQSQDMKRIDYANYHQFSLSVDMGDEILGHGFTMTINDDKTRTIKEYNTTAARFVLERSHNPDSKTGFFLKTVYPDISNVLARKEITDKNKIKDILEEVKKEDIIHIGGPTYNRIDKYLGTNESKELER